MAAGAQTTSPVHWLSAPSRAAAASALVPVALSSGLRHGVGFDTRGCSVLTTLGSVQGAPGSRVAAGRLDEPGRARLRWCSASALECSATSSESRTDAGLELQAPWDEALPLQAAYPG